MAKYPEINWKAGDLPAKFKLFKRHMELIHQDQDVQDPKRQAIKIKIALGGDGLHRLNTSGLSD